MAGYENNDINIPNDSDACYERVASQEEVSLEENEEKVEAILIAKDPTPPQESLSEQRNHAVEELITGDSDDPPLSEEAVRDMLKSN